MRTAKYVIWAFILGAALSLPALWIPQAIAKVKRQALERVEAIEYAAIGQ